MTRGTSLTDRMWGALRLDERTYEDLESDPKATGEAAFVVVASSLVAAAGHALMARGAVDAGLAAGIGALIGWALSAWIALFVGTRLLRGPATRATWSEVARTMGYANTPRFFLILVAVPGIGQLVQTVVALWLLATTVVAMRAAFDVSTGRAIAIAVASSVAQGIVVLLLLTVAGV